MKKKVAMERERRIIVMHLGAAWHFKCIFAHQKREGGRESKTQEAEGFSFFTESRGGEKTLWMHD